MDLTAAQAYMAQAGIDAWLLYDFHGGNPVLWRVLEKRKHTTRRCVLLIGRTGSPRLLVSPLDADLFAEFKLPLSRYVGREEFQNQLRGMLAGCARVAMEYSPGGALPIVSHVDAGTVELVRAMGVEVVSSGDLFQQAAARWSAQAYASHQSACRLVEETKDAAFAYIGQALAGGRSISEYDVQQFILQQFAQRGLGTEEPPIVGVNQNSGNPHYTPTAEHCRPIQKGDWVLIDLWAKHAGEQDVFADITWCGIAGPEPRPEHEKIFRIVSGARDAVVQRLRDAWQAGESLMGWELDRVARGVIEQAGFGPYFFHRTGHSMGPGANVHALGVNLDDLETHDTRRIVPGVGFSVEPGIYLPEFGVRSEINVFIDPQSGPVVTTGLQREIIRILPA